MFGMRKATLKASMTRPAPKRWAKTISRASPMTRLMAVPSVKDRTPREMSSMLRPLFDICGRDGKVYNAGAMSFDDKDKAPDDKALAQGLGPSKKLWDEFVRHIGADYAPVTEAWGFYKAWFLRLKQTPFSFGKSTSPPPPAKKTPLPGPPPEQPKAYPPAITGRR